ncbi:MAG: carboxypeptidase regulatory-like domain-containing protein [bacterium]
MLKKNRIRNLFLMVSLFSLTFLTQVGLKQSEPKPEAKTPLASGTITGVVKFPEVYPEREKITITKDQVICGAFQYDELFVVSEENHGLKNVVVSVPNVTGSSTAANGSVAKLDQNKCSYVPHVQVVPPGTTLEILNSDGILHNVHAYFSEVAPKNTVFNKAQPKFLKKIKQKLDKGTGMYLFKCDVHGHMSAYVAVMDHPYHSVTDENGSFTISNVPAGTYKIEAWHEALGTLEKEVKVEPGKTSKVVFDILPNE